MTTSPEQNWLKSPAPVRAYQAAPAAPGPPKPKKPSATDTWIHWTQAFAALAGLVHTAGTMVSQRVSDKDLANKIVHGLHALFKSIQAVNQAFKDEIEAIETGKPIEITVGPSDIPDWDDDDKLGLVDAIWEMLKPLLEGVMKQVAGKGGDAAVVADAINQFIQDSDKILDDLRPLFGEAKKKLAGH
jgi:hypothetical protein